MTALSGKVAIIAGATNRTGIATAKLFANEGVKVVITDLWPEKLNSLARDIREQGGIVQEIVHDIAEKAQWKEVIERTADMFGRIDILIINGGITPLQASLIPFSLEQWTRVIIENMNGSYFGFRTCLPYLKKTSGSVINVSSIARTTASDGTSAYAASKGAIRIFTKGVAREYGKYNIRANAVHPGVITSVITNADLKEHEVIKSASQFKFMPRMGSPENVAQAILYFASHESGFVTDTELIIDDSN
jgi:NAD(P)-dependent dehydrogenase (short-subunit alcohol dehydrogenase family)